MVVRDMLFVVGRKFFHCCWYSCDTTTTRFVIRIVGIIFFHLNGWWGFLLSCVDMLFLYIQNADYSWLAKLRDHILSSFIFHSLTQYPPFEYTGSFEVSPLRVPQSWLIISSAPFVYEKHRSQYRPPWNREAENRTNKFFSMLQLQLNKVVLCTHHLKILHASHTCIPITRVWNSTIIS